MTDLLFYKQIAALDKERHGKLKMAPVTDYSFAAKTNSIPLVAAEFTEAQREFPIVFAKGTEGGFAPVMLLGLRNAENLFVTADGRWDARFVPAFIRRYPFAPADVGDDRMVICVDESAACLQDKEGEEIFASAGETLLMQHVVSLLQAYQAQAQRTQTFCKRLSDLNLLMESNAQAQLPDGRTFHLSGLYVVDEKRLQVLDKEKINELFNLGELPFIYAHLMSLGNLQRLIDKLSERSR